VTGVRQRSAPAREPEARRPSGCDGDAWFDVVPLAFDGVLHDVNGHRACAGDAVIDGAKQAVLVAPDRSQILGTLGGSSSTARGINDEGAIVGGSLTAGDAVYHAFLYEHGVMHDLNDLVVPDGSCELVQALGINNAGDIVAIAHLAGDDHVVLLRRRAVATLGR
jgi:probable HAF family extracellular repeat protein